jgi:hypothetical protein
MASLDSAQQKTCCAILRSSNYISLQDLKNIQVDVN